MELSMLETEKILDLSKDLSAEKREELLLEVAKLRAWAYGEGQRDTIVQILAHLKSWDNPGVSKSALFRWFSSIAPDVSISEAAVQ